MPRIPAKQREAENVSIRLPGGRCCARVNDAPPSSTWEEHSTALLSNMSGDRMKRTTILEGAIQSLTEKREEFRKEKKTGALVASEAIEFYKYVLEMNLTWKGKGGIRKSASKRIEDSKKRTLVDAKDDASRKLQRVREDGSKEQTISSSECTDKLPDSAVNESPVVVCIDSTKEKVLTHLDDSDRQRSRRMRRQPTLFDPQTCPASEWVGDGLRVSSKSPLPETDRAVEIEKVCSEPSPTSNDDSSQITEYIAPERLAQLRRILIEKCKKREKSPKDTCKFCLDEDPSEICCFCACRVCFSKLDRDQSVVCAFCDAEFHSYCLMPPLEEIPCDEWFCPTCIDIAQKEDEERQIKKPKEPSKTGRKVGRPKGSFKKVPAVAPHETVQPATSATNSNNAVEVVHKRGPGRPRKSDSLNLQPVTTAVKPDKIPKHLRLEHKSHKKKLDPTASMMRTPSLKKGNDSTPSTSITVSSPASDNVQLLASSSDVAPSNSNSRSRSGRVVKRNHFYDQMDDREQHLKTSMRYVNDARKITKKKSESDHLSKNSSDGDLLHVGHVVPPSTQLIDSVGRNSRTSVMHASSLDDEVNVSNFPSDKHVMNMSTESVLSNSIQTSVAYTADATEKVSWNEDPSKPHLVEKSDYVARAARARSSVHENRAVTEEQNMPPLKAPRRKPGARECMQISRRFGVNVIPQKYIDILLDYCTRGKVEHLIRMRERLDEHSCFLELQLAGLEALLQNETASASKNTPV